MHSTDNEVTQEDLVAVDTIGGHMASYYEFGHSDEYAAAQEAARDFRLASIKAVCREKDAEIEGWRQKWIRSTDRCRDMKHERNQLRAKLDEATKVLADVSTAMLMGGDGAVGDYGWSIGKLNQARPAIRAFLASAPQPTPPASEEG